VYERFLATAELPSGQRQGEQPDAAVDVVADPAGRDHAVGQLRRGHGADGEAVALVDVRHRDRGLDDAGQGGDVLELCERVVAADRLEQPGVGEHARGDAHVRARVCADLPHDLVDPAQVGHHTSSTARARQTPSHASKHSRW